MKLLLLMFSFGLCLSSCVVGTSDGSAAYVGPDIGFVAYDGWGGGHHGHHGHHHHHHKHH